MTKIGWTEDTFLNETCRILSVRLHGAFGEHGRPAVVWARPGRSGEEVGRVEVEWGSWEISYPLPRSWVAIGPDRAAALLHDEWAGDLAAYEVGFCPHCGGGPAVKDPEGGITPAPNSNPTTERENVALHAMWSVGSCYGDGDPRVEREWYRVMADDAAFTEWAARKKEYDTWSEGGSGFGAFRGDPVSEDLPF